MFLRNYFYNIITSILPKKIKSFLKKFRKYNSIDDLDKKLLSFLNYQDGFYIECGANDGVNQSNTWYFEKSLNWKGFLIEPHPEKFNELIKNRDKKNIFINHALVSKNYNKDSIYLTNNDLMSKVVNEESSLEKKIKVKASTLTNLLEFYKAPKVIDLFVLDVEGYEKEVILGIDFGIYNFKYLMIETNKNEVLNILKKNNYKLLGILNPNNSPHDYLFEYNG